MNQDNRPTGIIVAMDSELKMLLNELKDCETVTANGFEYYKGTSGNRPVVATKCGIGKVNAAVGALTMIETFSPDAIINTGIAGGTGGGAGILDVVIGTGVAYHDVWCGPGNARGQVQGLPERFAGATGMFDLEQFGNNPRVKQGLIASGDMFVSTPGDLARVLEAQPDAVAVDMESGAIAQVCHLKGVPFLAVRVVSDTPGAEDHLSQYADFWNKAPETAFSVLSKLLKH